MMFDNILTPDVPREDVIDAVYTVLKAISHRGNPNILKAELKAKSQASRTASLVRQILEEIERRAGADFDKISRKKLEYYANKIVDIMDRRVQVYSATEREAAEAGLGQLRASVDV